MFEVPSWYVMLSSHTWCNVSLMLNTCKRFCVAVIVLCVTDVCSLAQSQQYDQDGIVDIFRQYGDHLYR